MFGFFVIISNLVKLFNQCGVLDFPRFIILLLKQLILFSLKDLRSSLEFILRSLHEQKCLLETSSSLFSLVFELTIKLIVNHESLMNSKLTLHPDEFTNPLIKTTELWNLSLSQNELLKVIKFSAQAKVWMSQVLAHQLNMFTSLGYLSIDSLILLIECIEISSEILSHVRCFTQYLTCKSLNLLHSSWSSWLLFDREIISKLILVLLLQKVYQELTSTKNLWFHDACQELLIIKLLFCKLFTGKFLFLVHQR